MKTKEEVTTKEKLETILKACELIKNGERPYSLEHLSAALIGKDGNLDILNDRYAAALNVLNH